MAELTEASKEQPVGFAVPEQAMGKPAPAYKGQYVTLELLAPKHFEQLWTAVEGDEPLWTYMLDGPYKTWETFQVALQKRNEPSETQFMYAIVDHRTQTAVGFLALFQAVAAHRSVELGHVLLSKSIQRTRGATEAFYLSMRAAFEDMHIRRLEWKCNAFNAPSKRAAERLGFQFEGTFRQHYIIKGHNRDSDWFSILDSEWPVVGKALEQWIDAGNFDEKGVQRAGLSDLRKQVAAASAAGASQ